MKKKLLTQGAEAKIYLTPKNNILKSRIPKSYRHKDLDKKIRTRRTKSEIKILTKAKEAKINVPKIINTNKFEITIEYIKGNRLSNTLNSYPTKSQLSIMQKLARQVAKLHKNNIIHSDLTTSNAILQNKSNKIFLIDFGLSYISTKIENKAVDIHLLHQALKAKHHKKEEALFKEFCKNYKHNDSEKILQRLKIVESRGRYKH